MKAFLRVNLIVCAILCAAAPFASANLITNGDFSTGDLTGWNVTHAISGSNISVNHNPDYHSDSPGAFFGSNLGGFDTISQTFDAIRGVYSLTFFFQVTNTANPPDNAFLISYSESNWNPDVSNVLFLSLRALPGTSTYTFNFFSNGGPITLDFRGRNSQGFDYLDDVDVEFVPTPETGSTALLMGIALVGLFVVQRFLITRRA